jgi:diguanylate cyclase (GGDEF)-like protein
MSSLPALKPAPRAALDGGDAVLADDRALGTASVRSRDQNRPWRAPRSRVLLIEDNPSDAFLTAEYLPETAWTVTVLSALDEAIEELRRREYDAVIADLTLPDATGLDSVERIHAFAPEVPLVVLTGAADERLALDALQAGAEDFVAKNDLSAETLARALRHARERKEFELGLRKRANEDRLTGLANRYRFDERLTEAVARARRARTRFAIACFDLDGFKRVNDELGHEAGDLVLAEVGRRLRATLRESDFAARLGGDEFAILIELLKDPSEANGAAARLLAALEQPYGDHPALRGVSASIGIAVSAEGQCEPGEILLRSADAAMYAAKRAGKNRIAVTRAPGVVDAADPTLTFLDALEKGDVCLHYQVQVRPGEGPPSAEALVRWRRDGQLVLPGEFLPVIERTSAIGDLGRWVIETACRQLASWRAEGRQIERVAVNVSARQLDNTDLVGVIEHALDRAGLPPSALEIELTETAVMRNLENAARVLSELKRLGVRVAMDDFGTGHASLSYLSRLPFDVLKIDRSFVGQLFANPRSATTLRAIIALGHELGLEVVAEGVETQSQLEVLTREGCDRFQGYLLGKPLEADDFGQALAR